MSPEEINIKRLETAPDIPNSYANYVDALRVHILPALGKIPLQKLTTDTIQEFYDQKAEAGRADGKPGGLSSRILALFHQLILPRRPPDRESGGRKWPFLMPIR